MTLPAGQELPPRLKAAEKHVTKKGGETDLSPLMEEGMRELYGPKALRSQEMRNSVKTEINSFLWEHGAPENFFLADIRSIGNEKVFVGQDGSQLDHLGREIIGVNRLEPKGGRRILASANGDKYTYDEKGLSSATWTEPGTNHQVKIFRKDNEWVLSETGKKGEMKLPVKPILDQSSGDLSYITDIGLQVTRKAGGGVVSKDLDDREVFAISYPNGAERRFDRDDASNLITVDYFKNGKRRDDLSWTKEGGTWTNRKTGETRTDISIDPLTGSYSETREDGSKIVIYPSAKTVGLAYANGSWRAFTLDAHGKVMGVDYHANAEEDSSYYKFDPTTGRYARFLAEGQDTAPLKDITFDMSTWESTDTLANGRKVVHRTNGESVDAEPGVAEVLPITRSAAALVSRAISLSPHSFPADPPISHMQWTDLHKQAVEVLNHTPLEDQHTFGPGETMWNLSEANLKRHGHATKPSDIIREVARIAKQNQDIFKKVQGIDERHANRILGLVNIVEDGTVLNLSGSIK
jgi:hypothetical protein